MKRPVESIMRSKWLLLVVALATGFAGTNRAAVGQVESARGLGSTGKTVALTSGTCASVSDGDTVTLDWYPAFEHANVDGMRYFEISFAKAEDEGHVARLGAPLILVASPRTHGELPGQLNPEIEDAGNGLYRIRFHPDLSHVEPGEYHLVGAQAYGHTQGTNQGPEMSNSPVGSYYCLNVVASEIQRRR